ncbi:MAG: flagellar basal body-associated FliL family protein [Lachnospiraceae bacterium]|nr:flagellar basal body-associated FliL family protein [Lachnospiraceae bacterium]
MKKNLLTVITLALVLVNLVLTVIVTITIIPETKQANELITKVCAAIDLDLESGSATSNANIPIDKVALVPVGEEDLTINLKKGADSASHYAMIKVSLSLNKDNEDYDDVNTQVSDKLDLVKGEIFNVVSSYTMEELQGNQDAVREDILKNLQQMFGSDAIIDVTFSSVKYQ